MHILRYPAISLALAFLATLIALLFVGPAFAADTAVSVPWGNWVSEILSQLMLAAGTIIAFVLAWAVRYVPAALRGYADKQRIAQVEQLLERALGWGVGSVKGAVEGKSLSVDVGSKVVAEALQYAVDNGPGWLIGWMGGIDGVREKLLARLPITEAATIPEIAAQLPPPLIAK